MKRILLINILTTILLSIGMGIGGWLLGTTHAQESSNVILACVDNLTGSVRIVAAHSECKPSETGTQWNVQGPQGSTGSSGPAGAPGLSGYEIVTVGIETGVKIGIASCPSEKTVIGGGFSLPISSDDYVKSSQPYGNAWLVTLHLPASVASTVFAICAYVES